MHTPSLGFAIAVIDSKTEHIYWTVREQVSVHPHLRSTGIATQLHAYDPKHLDDDGLPSIFEAVRTELMNEAGLTPADIKDLYVAGWGVGTRTGTPELLFVCHSRKKLSKILADVHKSRVEHAAEFDRMKMRATEPISIDYELLADLQRNRDLWEPEAAVACCLALHAMWPNAVTFEKRVLARNQHG